MVAEPSPLRPVLVYGATGYTGRLCVAALEALGAPYLVGGRDMEALRSVAGPGCAGIRVAHAHDIGDAFEGVGCVLSTVGPFARLGLAPLDAAIAAGAHWVDTTAEQSFVEMALTRSSAAEAAGVCVLPACGVEYLPVFVAAALLGDGPVATYIWLDDFLPTPGSVRSMVALAGVGATPIPSRVDLGGRQGSAILIPGVECLLVHPESTTHLVLKRHEAWAFTLMWPLAKLFKAPRYAETIAARVTQPTEAQRSAARFTVVVQQRERAVRIDGGDVYETTGRYAAYVASQLAQGAASIRGVHSAAKALDPQKIVEDLRLAPQLFEP